MKVKNKKIQEIRKQLTIRDHTHLFIEFDMIEVYERFPDKGISGIWKKLTNGLVKYNNTDNRSWYKKLNVNGYYTYIIYKDRIELSLFLDREIDIGDFINRLKFICPVKTYKIGYNKPTELIETDSSLFGEFRINKLRWN
jgi:hypothetical protein